MSLCAKMVFCVDSIWNIVLNASKIEQENHTEQS